MEALDDLVGTSPAIGALRRRLARLSRVGSGGEPPAAMLIHGETGTGKGLVARLIHRSGPRSEGPFVSMNCAAVPAALFEAELPGLLEAAHRGTLYLDEIGLLPESVQAGIMAAVDSGDVSVIGGTPSDLARSVRSRRFREDLYRRLAATTVVLPPLRERGRDALTLADRFLDRLSRDHGVPPKRLDRSARATILEHDWPGNIRELLNVLERAVIGSDTPVLSASALGLPALGRASTPSATVSRDAAVRQHLEAALERTGWNIARTAALLGVARNTVYAHIEKFGLGNIAPRPATLRPARSLERPAPVSDDRLRWERRSLALLAARVEGAARSVAQTSAALETVVEKVETFGARVEELTPTSVVAAFGLDGVEDALRRAAHAALAIHKAIERSHGEGSSLSRVAVGLHAAPMLVGRRRARSVIDGDSARAERAVLDRLLGTGAPGETVVSAAAAPVLERRFELMLVTASGGEAYRLTGPERRGLELWGTLTPFVGRRPELAALQAGLTRASGGHGEVVLIEGEAGVGKSRLLWELTRSRRVRDWHVLEMRCVPFGRAAAEHPVGGLLRAHFGIDRLDAAAATRRRVAAGLRALDERLESAMPGICSWLEIPVEDAGWQVREPAERRRAAVAAVTQLMLSQSAARPVLLLIEDLHWVDSETESVLDELVGNLAGARLLVVVTRRSGAPPHPWEGLRATRRMDVRALPPAEAGRMLRQLVGDDPTLPSTKRLVTEAAEGNPFFMEESVRTLVETGALAGERGRYRAVAPLTRLAVPATVEELLAHRIDRLAPADRRLLQCAAAIGREAPLDILESVSDDPASPLRASVARLVAAEFLHHARTDDGPVCVFNHALTRETAYASLPDHEKPPLHRRIFFALEALPRREQTDEIERLAHHAFRAGVWDKAVTYLRQAGERAFRRWANGEAEERFSQALAALAHWPDGRARAELGIDLRLSLRDPLWVLGRMEDMRARLAEARSLAETIGDAGRLGWACCHQARLGWALAEHDRALDAGERALAIAAETGDQALAVETRFYVAAVALAKGECGRAAAMLRQNLAALEDDRIRLPRRFRVQGPLLHRGYLARCLAEMGEFEEAIACAETARDLADSDGNPFSRVTARFGLGNAFLRQGRPADAIAPLERGVELGREVGLENWMPALLATLGAAYAATGRGGEGRRLIEEAIARSEAAHILSSHTMWVVYLGEAWLSEGRPDEARTQALRARELARARGERGFEAWAVRTLGGIAARAGERGAALESYREAMGMALALDMRPLAGRCLVEISRVLGDAL